MVIIVIVIMVTCVNVEFLSWKDPRISDFLNSSDHLIFHTLEYAQFISAAFSCDYLFACAVEENAVKTVLPFVEVKSKIFGSRIISSAYLEYGGFAGEAAGIKPVLGALQKKYGAHFDYLEVRGGMEEFGVILSSEMIKKKWYKRFVLDLSNFAGSSSGGALKEAPVPKEINIITEEPNRVLNKSIFGNVEFSSGDVAAILNFRQNIQKSKRKAILKAKRSKVIVKDIPLEDLDLFYELYSRNMKRFGSPAYSKKYFIEFYHHLVSKGLAKIYGAYVKKELAAALLGFCYRNRVHVLIAVSDERKQEFRPNDAVHSEFIEWAIGNNFKFFDFGRVREDSGQFEYKQKWGPELSDLPSYFLMWKRKDVPVIDPQNTKYRFFVAAWKKMPSWAAKKIGHRLRKELGI